MSYVGLLGFENRRPNPLTRLATLATLSPQKEARAGKSLRYPAHLPGPNFQPNDVVTPKSFFGALVGGRLS